MIIERGSKRAFKNACRTYIVLRFLGSYNFARWRRDPRRRGRGGGLPFPGLAREATKSVRKLGAARGRSTWQRRGIVGAAMGIGRELKGAGLGQAKWPRGDGLENGPGENGFGVVASG